MAAESQLDRRISDAFSAVGHVESVYALQSGEKFTVFTIIDEDEEDAYDLIYEQERRLIREFGGVRFDFNVIARQGRPIAGIMGACSPIWQRTESAPSCPNATNT